jgi:hypothetical protein
MPDITLTYRFLDGTIEIEIVVYDSNDSYEKTIFEHLQARKREWKESRGVIDRQIVITNREGVYIPSHFPFGRRILLADDTDECSYTFGVLFVPLLYIPLLNENEVEEVYHKYHKCDDIEPCNENSFQRFACVLWINRSLQGRYVQDTVFYRVKPRHIIHIHNTPSVASVHYGGDGVQPCWDPEIPMTRLAAERWSRLLEEYNTASTHSSDEE